MSEGDGLQVRREHDLKTFESQYKTDFSDSRSRLHVVIYSENITCVFWNVWTAAMNIWFSKNRFWSESRTVICNRIPRDGQE